MTLVHEKYDAVVEIHLSEPDVPLWMIAEDVGCSTTVVEKILSDHYAGCRARAEANRVRMLPPSMKTVIHVEAGSFIHQRGWRQAA